MAVSYEIIPEIGIVYVRYWGVAEFHDTIETFARFAQDPQFSPHLKHLVDLAGVVEYDRNYPELMKLQAGKVDTLSMGAGPSYLIYYAPTRISQSMARMILKSWDGLSSIVGRMATDEGEALEMLGVPQRSFADLPMNRV